jgi:sterol desaturase/sphingolipid hydroxylase (fatty acid hydroxylase superfamily)
MDSLTRESVLFLAFWGAVIALGTIEYLAPQFAGDADRRRRWFTNFGLGILNGLIVSAIPAATVSAALWAHESHFGLLNLLSAPWWLLMIVTVLVRSLAQYVFHVLCHKTPLLWRLHRVHHSDVHLDVSSALRNHPLEFIISIAFLTSVIAICGLSPVALAVYETVEVFANIITHANLRTSNVLESRVRSVFVTPGLHRLHHSPIQVETDSNYGNVFAVWDRLFGTYRGETIQSGPELRFGLDEVSHERAGDLQAQLALPWHRDAPSRG